MSTLKPFILLLMAATLVILGSRPLARTGWAADLRVSRAASHAARTARGAPPRRDFLTPLAKEVLFMAFPATALVFLLRRKRSS